MIEIDRRAPMRERLAQAMMNVTDADGTPLLNMDPDFNDLPNRANKGEMDDFAREDVLALVDAALEELRWLSPAMRDAGKNEIRRLSVNQFCSDTTFSAMIRAAQLAG